MKTDVNSYKMDKNEICFEILTTFKIKLLEKFSRYEKVLNIMKEVSLDSDVDFNLISYNSCENYEKFLNQFYKELKKYREESQISNQEIKVTLQNAQNILEKTILL